MCASPVKIRVGVVVARLLVVVALIGATSCAPLMKVKAQVVSALDRFHALYNAGDFNSMYEELAPGFKSVSNLQDFSEVMGSVRSQLGVVKSSEIRGFQANYSGGKMRVKVAQKMAFEKGAGVEFIALEESAGGVMRVMSYDLDSPQLKKNPPRPPSAPKTGS